MRPFVFRGLVCSALVSFAPARAETQQPRLAVAPRQAAGGALVRVTIDRIATANDSIVSITGRLADEPLHFLPGGTGTFVAFGAIPVGVSDSLVARARIERRSGAVDTARLLIAFPHRPAPVATRARAAGASRLRVDARFTQPMTAETEARIERENALAREVGRKAHDTPQLWTLPFTRPRPSKVTSRFGSGRLFNGRVSSSHLGVDYRGKTGEAVFAANRGIVALVGEFFLAGNVVYIDHGSGVVTGYFHLSETKVAKGDTVERGQELGLVGATGRVTASHLHWSARYGSLTIDPGDLFELRPPFVRLPITK